MGFLRLMISSLLDFRASRRFWKIGVLEIDELILGVVVVGNGGVLFCVDADFVRQGFGDFKVGVSFGVSCSFLRCDPWWGEVGFIGWEAGAHLGERFDLSETIAKVEKNGI